MVYEYDYLRELLLCVCPLPCLRCVPTNGSTGDTNALLILLIIVVDGNSLLIVQIPVKDAAFVCGLLPSRRAREREGCTQSAINLQDMTG